MNTAQQEPPQGQQEPQQGQQEPGQGQQEPGQGQQGPQQGNGKSSTCDPGEIGQLACTAKKYAKQAEVMTEQAVKDLETYRTQFTEARQKYTDARVAAKTELEAIWKILHDLEDQLKCRLNDGQEECLYEAAEKVFDEIEDCSDNEEGCESPCDDSPAPDPESQTDSATLAAEIARRRANLAESAKRFKDLIAEPDEIKKRVGDQKTKAEALAKDVTAGGDNTKLVSWFARLLIMEYWATPERIWHGFPSAGAYLDCVCGLLKCLVSGWTAVAILEGRKAELDCENDAEDEACKQKKEDTLVAILDAYEECWKSKQESSTPADDKESTAGSDTSSQSGKQDQRTTQGDPAQEHRNRPAWRKKGY
jgi:hypothetical protein